MLCVLQVYRGTFSRIFSSLELVFIAQWDNCSTFPSLIKELLRKLYKIFYSLHLKKIIIVATLFAEKGIMKVGLDFKTLICHVFKMGQNNCKVSGLSYDLSSLKNLHDLFAGQQIRQQYSESDSVNGGQLEIHKEILS